MRKNPFNRGFRVSNLRALLDIVTFGNGNSNQSCNGERERRVDAENERADSRRNTNPTQNGRLVSSESVNSEQRTADEKLWKYFLCNGQL